MRPSTFEHVMIKSPKTGTVVCITSIAQAADILANQWPTQHGPQHAAASKLCKCALNGKASVASARKAFVEAAKEIDAYIEEKTLKPSQYPVSL